MEGPPSRGGPARRPLPPVSWLAVGAGHLAGPLSAGVPPSRGAPARRPLPPVSWLAVGAGHLAGPLSAGVPPLAGRACAAGAPISSRRNGGKEGPGGFAHPGPPRTGAHGGGGLYGQGRNRARIDARFVGTSFRSFASPQAAKLTPSTVPPLPTEPASLGFGGGPVFTDATGAAAPWAARIGIAPQTLKAAALYRPGPPGRRRCHAAEIPSGHRGDPHTH